jgi:hypothetical protein
MPVDDKSPKSRCWRALMCDIPDDLPLRPLGRVSTRLAVAGRLFPAWPLSLPWWSAQSCQAGAVSAPIEPWPRVESRARARRPCRRCRANREARPVLSPARRGCKQSFTNRSTTATHLRRRLLRPASRLPNHLGSFAPLVRVCFGDKWQLYTCDWPLFCSGLYLGLLSWVLNEKIHLNLILWTINRKIIQG